jgi:hypothetical protein
LIQRAKVLGAKQWLRAASFYNGNDAILAYVCEVGKVSVEDVFSWACVNVIVGVAIGLFPKFTRSFLDEVAILLLIYNYRADTHWLIYNLLLSTGIRRDVFRGLTMDDDRRQIQTLVRRWDVWGL